MPRSPKKQDDVTPTDVSIGLSRAKLILLYRLLKTALYKLVFETQL